MYRLLDWVLLSFLVQHWTAVGLCQRPAPKPADPPHEATPLPQRGGRPSMRGRFSGLFLKNGFVSGWN